MPMVFKTMSCLPNSPFHCQKYLLLPFPCEKYLLCNVFPIYHFTVEKHLLCVFSNLPSLVKYLLSSSFSSVKPLDKELSKYSFHVHLPI
jgi:hypothetical protein